MSFEHPLFGKMLEPKDMSDEHHEAIRRCLDEVGDPASPVPLESMIEEIGERGTICIGPDEGRWIAWMRDDLYLGSGDTPREAIESLHAAWKERQDGE